MSVWWFDGGQLFWSCLGAVLHPAGVNRDCVLALLAADRAAPRELAGAALHHLGPTRSVARPAAHQLAPVWRQPRGSCGGFIEVGAAALCVIDWIAQCVLTRCDGPGINLTIASPPSSPRDTVVRVEMAEIWRRRKVHKVSGSRGLDLWVTGEQGCPGSDTSQAHLGGGGCLKLF